MKIKLGTWYNEFNSVVIHDYINIMIHQFPLMTIRKYIFDIDGKYPKKVIVYALLGVSFTSRPKSIT